MSPTQEELAAADCWFTSDQVGGREMTAFKREARWRQHRWAVDEQSVSSFGRHRGRRTHPDVAPEDVGNGTKLLDVDAEAGCNFLTTSIHRVAGDRVATPQPHETLDATRLHRDLLSSMPMAFNLFGEASLPENGLSRDRLADLFGVPCGPASDIVFEWSPARRSAEYTRDRTAFDVALRTGDEDGPPTVVGVETKYHEHSATEASPSARAAAAHRDQTDFLVDVAVRSGVFAPGWEDRVLRTDLRQIWRDHLLALSMRAHPDRWGPQTRYVLVHPVRNVSFRDAAARYAALLEPGDTSFLALTIEDVVDAAFAHGSSTKDAFVRRYLW